MIIGSLIVVFLILSVVAGVLLVRQQQNIQEKASGDQCPAAEACPVSGQPNLLRNCHPGESVTDPAESLCNQAGRIETCGTRQYCCPSAGGSWSSNLSLCPSPTPKATPTPTATVAATATATPSGTGTPSATPTRTPTPAGGTAQPIPATGTGWPTIVGAGLGVLVIVASVLIAL